MSRDSSSDESKIWTTPSDGDAPILSIAWNIRRIFVVMLTGLVIVTISLIATLYVSIADDPSEAIVIGAILLSVLVAVAGVWYAIISKRVSR